MGGKEPESSEPSTEKSVFLVSQEHYSRYYSLQSIGMFSDFEAASTEALETVLRLTQPVNATQTNAVTDECRWRC